MKKKRKKRELPCDKDCLNCKFDDCILTDYAELSIKEYSKRYREEHREEVREYGRRWYEEHKYEQRAKKKAQRKKERELKYGNCYICSKPIRDGEKVYIYTSKAFCCAECFGLYLVSRSKIVPRTKGEL